MHRPGLLHIAPLWLAATLTVPVAPAFAADNAANSAVDPAATTFQANTVLSFDIPKLSEKIKPDGKLDEAVWANAKKLTNFCEVDPGDNCAPAVQTEAWVAYDADYLYVAFKCYDDNMGALRATVTD